MIIIRKRSVDDVELLSKNKNKHFFIGPELLSNSIQSTIIGKLKDTSDSYKIDKKIDGVILSQEYVTPQDAAFTRIINSYLTKGIVIDSVRKISNNLKINSFKRRGYKFEADEFSFVNWHDDINDDNRLLGLSINLSEEIYQGRKFQIRDKNITQVYSKVKHLDWGKCSLL
jgi:hypothetical protein